MSPKVTKQLFDEKGTVLQVWHSMSSSEAGIKHYTFAIAFEMTSAQHDNAIQGIYRDLDVSFKCSCKGSQFAGTCWHIDHAQEQFDA